MTRPLGTQFYIPCLSPITSHYKALTSPELHLSRWAGELVQLAALEWGCVVVVHARYQNTELGADGSMYILVDTEGQSGRGSKAVIGRRSRFCSRWSEPHSVCEDIPQQLGEGLYLLLHLSLYWSGLIRCIMSGGGLTDPRHSLRTKFKWLGSSHIKTQADRVFWCFSITGRPSVIGLVYQKCAPDNSDLLKLYNYLTLGLKDPSRKVMFAFCVLWQFCSLNNACSKIRSVYCIGI